MNPHHLKHPTRHPTASNGLLDYTILSCDFHVAVKFPNTRIKKTQRDHDGKCDELQVSQNMEQNLYDPKT